MKQESLPITVRVASQSDIGFIFNSWLKSYKGGGLFTYDIPPAVYFTEHHKILERLLKRSTVIVACDSQDPTLIYGYLIAEEIEGFPVLHFCYVKNTFRGFGISNILLACLKIEMNSPLFISHMTKAFKMRLMHKFHIIYNPYLMLEPENFGSPLAIMEEEMKYPTYKAEFRNKAAYLIPDQDLLKDDSGSEEVSNEDKD